MTLASPRRHAIAVSLMVCAAILGGAASALLAVCGPFTDVSDATFCPFVLEVFTLAITTGTTPTTYDPSGNVSRLQMAAFLSRTVDRTLQRGSHRAALGQFWTPQSSVSLGLTTVGDVPLVVQSDGEDLWVANVIDETVSRVHASSGKLLETWTGATGASGVTVGLGRILVAGGSSLYRIDPAKPAGAVTTVAANLGAQPVAVTFDGARFWTANRTGASVSIVTPGAGLPWTVMTVTTGFSPLGPGGILYDGANVWLTDFAAGTLLKLNGSAAILQTITVGSQPGRPTFDGNNIWVPNNGSSSVSVVRASTGTILTTLTGNGLNGPSSAAFDGQRVLVTNIGGDSASLWKAADLTTLGSFTTGTGTQPNAVCSDGVNFWISLTNVDQLARF